MLHGGPQCASADDCKCPGAEGGPQAQGEEAFISQMPPLACSVVAPFARDRLPVSSAVN